ncbi:arrestin domain-containing protein 3-like [Toxorhynchites rutilus septentrionalis]|uniref:arrestin domain-containing protein 3-like n=1 Tax=Toxorhynchites rutilus septentrionalis TaxID=329112 RepID=UPI0024790AC8|nr:arrestin domain-containing protein 3-like [Toxorhynchites rutilus septentrionalis]
MDYIKELDIRLDKEYYYAGEVLSGKVIMHTTENFKLKSIRLLLRGKAHVEWKVFVSGDKRTVKDDQLYIEERAVIWGERTSEGMDVSTPVLIRGQHQFSFRFNIPETNLPCSFESRVCYIRYFVKVTIDIPYASPPQGIKYFTIVGPHIDCMDEQYLKPISVQDKKVRCCLCCAKGPVTLSCSMDRTAFCCGETLKLKSTIDNQGEESVKLKVRLVQFCEFFVERGVLGVTKEVQHLVLEHIGELVTPKNHHDTCANVRIPTVPTTLMGVCRLVQIYYTLTACLEFEKSGDDLHINFPITIGTVPFRIPNSNLQPHIGYDVAIDHVEGGIYIGPEFLLGEVYDGCNVSDNEYRDLGPVFRPVYLTVIRSSQQISARAAGRTNRKKSCDVEIAEIHRK